MLVIFLVLAAVVFSYFFLGQAPQNQPITWGVVFSQTQATSLGLDWQKTYLALLDDLGVKNIKLATYWDLIEEKEGEYNFQDLDWQIQQAKNKGIKIILSIGMKTPRWPECHLPQWAVDLGKEKQQEEISVLLEKIVLRYQDSTSIIMWQVENEPFFPFGECPWVDKNFLKKEIALVKSLDNQKRPIVISDSGEGSFWINAARMGDVVGTTMYKKVWFTVPNFLKKYVGPLGNFGFYLDYPFPAVFYWRKAEIVKKLFNKEVICVELQAEPWGKLVLALSPVSEQIKTMNLEQFQKNITFAKKTGLNKFYLWGGEWWYWLKEKQNDPAIWNEAAKLFKN